MNSNHHQAEDRVSQVVAPAFLYGSIGVLLAVGMQVVGFFKKADEVLLAWMLDPVFQNQIPETLSLPLVILLAALFSYGLAFAVLDTPRAWRRLLLGVTLLVLILAMVPAFAVWQIYFSPFLVLLAVFWVLFCTMMYVNYHTMPCEASYIEDQPKEKKHG